MTKQSQLLFPSLLYERSNPVQGAVQPSKAALRRRAARIAEGERQRASERDAWPGRRVTHSELILPMLKLIGEAGTAAPADLYDNLVEQLGLDPSVRDETATYDGRQSRLFDRTVRFAMQTAKRDGLIASERRARWHLTDAGNEALGKVQYGTRLLVFRTELGEAIAAMAQDAAAIIDEGSAQCCFTSPLFPILSGKSYGGMAPDQWLPWMNELLASWLPLMRDDGCIAVHLGTAHYRGMTSISSYRERFALAAVDDLGLYRQPDFYWANPTRLPPIEWGAKRGILPRLTVDPIFVFSKSPTPFMRAGDMREELHEPRPSKPRGHERRPSGLDFGPGSFDSGKTPFPSNLIVAGNGASNCAWRRALKANNLDAHPCPMPMDVCRYVVEMLSREGDLVIDPFGGSGTLAAAAEEKGRRWITIDHHQQLLEGAALRPQFTSAPGYRTYAGAHQ